MSDQETITRLTEALQAIGSLPLEFNGRARAIAQATVTAPEGGWKYHLSPEQINNLLKWAAPTKEKTLNTETKAAVSETKTANMGIEQPKVETKQPETAYLPPAIEMIPVESSNILGFGHDGNRTLRVWFKNESKYDYPGATETQFFDLVNAESPGKAYNAFRKDSGILGIKL